MSALAARLGDPMTVTEHQRRLAGSVADIVLLNTDLSRPRSKGGSLTNWLELAEFFFESYQHTPREKLLEWMDAASDIAERARKVA
jgi:hypothetical protein